MKIHKFKFYDHKYNDSTCCKWFVARTTGELYEKVVEWKYENGYRNYNMMTEKFSHMVLIRIIAFFITLIFIATGWAIVESALYGEIRPSTEDTIIAIFFSWLVCDKYIIEK